jgi:DHA1 family multidrug resistance protein-like MFS transporter
VTRPPRDDWAALLAVYGLTAVIESSGVSQIFALLPTRLLELGVTGDARLAFIGIFSSLIFVVGAPLVPLWGVWADRISRTAVIARSAVVEMVVFAGIALAAAPWQLAIALLLVGFQLGNTGVMLAAIRDAAPPRRIGLAVAIFGACGPIGFALGPAAAGFLIDRAGWSLAGVFWLSSALSLAAALLVWRGTREVRPEVVPSGSTVSLAYGALRGVVTDPAVRRIFAIYTVAFLATQMSRPFLPILVERLVGTGTGLASAVALVVGTAALAGALVSPLGGALGDRVGFRRVLIGGLALSGVTLLAMPFAPAVGALALASLAFAAFIAVTTAMVFGLLATETPPERRSATLNLVYLPLYAAGIVGPALAAAAAGIGGASAPFLAAGIAVLGGTALVAVGLRRTRMRADA